MLTNPKIKRCFDCLVEIKLAYLKNRRGTLEGLCFDCYYPLKTKVPKSEVK
jgi:hypothetical protein